MKLQRFIQGIRLPCPSCQKDVTPYLMLDVDDSTGLLDEIGCACPNCQKTIRVLK
jgi:Zn ribbon nucleic-acid-binding protein